MILLALALLAGGTPVPDQFAQLTVRERIVIRMNARATPAPIIWREHKGPHCITVADLAGAALTGPDQIDFVLRGGTHVRAKLESACPALAFYGGFYLRPGEDGQVCQERDAVHARSGAECPIVRFRLLTPKTSK